MKYELKTPELGVNITSASITKMRDIRDNSIFWELKVKKGNRVLKHEAQSLNEAKIKYFHGYCMHIFDDKNVWELMQEIKPDEIHP